MRGGVTSLHRLRPSQIGIRKQRLGIDSFHVFFPSNAQRLGDTAEEEVRLDPMELERRRSENALRFHVIVVPLIRVLGMNAILVAVLLHHHLIGPAVGATGLWMFAAGVEAYCAFSWVLMWGLWKRLRPLFDLQFLLIGLDILLCAVATYVTGGERSWLFFLLLLRLADQSLSFRNVLTLAHLVPAVYVGMLVYVAAFDGRTILIGPALAKSFSLYGAGIYFALIAQMAETLRDRLRSAIRFGRDLVRELEEKSARLEYSMKKAEEASRLKTQFLSTVSHELRTPLTALLSRTEMLIDEADKERDAALIEDLRQITATARQLSGIINDVLDVAKVESGRTSLSLERFDAAAVADDALHTIEPLADRARIRIVVERAADLGMMHADRPRVRQILLNLVGNAIKFTEGGTVGLGVTRVHGGVAGDVMVFRVWDTGIGMTPEVQARLFTPFMQGDASTTRKYGGTGLGLAIAKQFTDLMGGTLSCVSTRGLGSVFTLRIPADVEQALLAGQRESRLGNSGHDSRAGLS